MLSSLQYLEKVKSLCWIVHSSDLSRGRLWAIDRFQFLGHEMLVLNLGVDFVVLVVKIGYLVWFRGHLVMYEIVNLVVFGGNWSAWFLQMGRSLILWVEIVYEILKVVYGVCLLHFEEAFRFMFLLLFKEPVLLLLHVVLRYISFQIILWSGST